MRRISTSMTAIAVAISVPFLVAPASAEPVAQATKPAPAPLSQLVKSIDIPYQEFTLANGLRVIVHEDRKAPVVAVSVWYDIGSKHEPKGKTGFAHLFEHLMFNGTENSPGEYFEPLQQIGATDLNGTTFFDRTNYFQTVPLPALDMALFLESDRMGYLLGAVTQGKLDEQRGVVQNEKRQGDNNPYGLTFYEVLKGLFPEGHPYSHSTIGSMADLDAASLADVKQWFTDHYGPNNAVLVLAGDINAAEARPLVEKYFGAIKRGPETRTPDAPVVPLSAPKRVEMKDRVATTRISRYWPTPGLNDPEATLLQIGGSALGGLASSRLDNALVREDKLAVSVSAGESPFAQVGFFSVSADVRPGVDPALVEKRMDEVVAKLLAEGPTADEVARVTTSTVSGRLSGLEAVGGFGGKAVALAEGALYSDNPGYYKVQLERMAAATPATVKAAMNKWIGKPALTIVTTPGERPAYAEAQAPAAKPAAAPAKDEAVKGTRGPLPQVGDVSALEFPKVERAKLNNGIELVYAQRTALPITQVVMQFDAGAVADPDDKLGTQAMMLAVMDEGTKSLNSVQLAEAQERLGARISTNGSSDRTAVTLYTPSANMAGSVALFADVVRNPAFAPAEVDRVRAQQLARIKQELSSPQGLGQRAMPKLLYGDKSAYAKLAAATGDPAVIASLQSADLAAFHQAWLRPEKAKIFVVSDRPLAEVKAEMDRAFADWKAAGTAGTKVAGTNEQASPRILLIDRPQSPQSLILGAQLTKLDPKSDLLPYQTANEVLGGSFLSRINMDLREEKSWSYGAGGRFNQLDNAVTYVVSAPVQADKTGPAIESLKREVTEFLTTNGVQKDEFERTINGQTRELAGNFERASSVLSAMIQNDELGRPDNYYTTIAQKYRALTAQQLDAAARSTFDPAKFVWVVVGDAKVVKPQLDSLGLPVEVKPMAELTALPQGKAAATK
ncbi:pitrilysin family protein [Sphingomonas sp. BGYR3]|uniref:M16 family metallopeptidase n=1 Tax=Sphingomonas sp. BGYR3 TaxID=2975483 RepID=UPI0021A95704|nr:pitrilysin family protein [Sphingomonas sp. BGYR3]MDG5488964.1 pitrilysin family protein [Sphingomonas sp. BGYR3]